MNRFEIVAIKNGPNKTYSSYTYKNTQNKDWAYLKKTKKDGGKNNREETNRSKIGRPSAVRRISWSS